MPFCINCGAQNQVDNTFCVACGQPLYREQRNVTASASHKHNWLLTVVLCVLATVTTTAILVASLSRNTHQASQNSQKEPASTTPISSDAVLTVIGMDAKGSPVDQGSGFILSSDGLGVTNYHVIKGVASATAECCNGRTLQVETIEGADLEKDLILFQLYDGESQSKPRNLPYLRIRSSGDLPVGQKVIVIGSPQGLANTVSDGILSAVREYDSIRYLQITAPISPGSSGGPVLDANGEVVGIATFQLDKGQNLNFAVDSQYLRSILDEHFGVSIAEFRSLVRQAQEKEQNKKRAQTANGVSNGQNTVSDAMTGDFTGTVHNETANLSAQFEIFIQDTQGSLSGCMGVVHPLYGSGPLSGSTTGSDVTFVVTSAIGTITFTGRREKNSIYGWYTVRKQDSPTQLGTFDLEKESSKGPGPNFDTSRCPTDVDMNK